MCTPLLVTFIVGYFAYNNSYFNEYVDKFKSFMNIHLNNKIKIEKDFEIISIYTNNTDTNANIYKHINDKNVDDYFEYFLRKQYVKELETQPIIKSKYPKPSNISSLKSSLKQSTSELSLASEDSEDYYIKESKESKESEESPEGPSLNNFEKSNFLSSVLDPSSIISFDDPIYVNYKLYGKIYSMCVTAPLKIIERAESNDDIYKRNIIFANLTADITNNVAYYSEDVTNILKRFQGPNSDFYINIEGVSRSYNSIFYVYDFSFWNILTISDTYGDDIIINLQHTNMDDDINWNPYRL